MESQKRIEYKRYSSTDWMLHIRIIFSHLTRNIQTQCVTQKLLGQNWYRHREQLGPRHQQISENGMKQNKLCHHFPLRQYLLFPRSTKESCLLHCRLLDHVVARLHCYLDHFALLAGSHRLVGLVPLFQCQPAGFFCFQPALLAGRYGKVEGERTWWFVPQRSAPTR